ncbi:E3 ubiquitin-protein ligase listerin [Tachyglossus aculeatus]|uniref:E3 ubiquitin-protein ligase listerin n=1 Tax=Tachyglossus aculeatus TaxID=9261 RepID=UPI0018F55712|nr:E3 ubiquitin-protein ligase listerin [Tachyglossus aculeatus]
MGGKNKQRTKGNLRPSSSGRAAELLAKERGTVPGFLGFGTSPSDLGYVPAVQGAEEMDGLVEADFRVVLRKLSKKDVTTKLKAMQEFGAMCRERDAETVRGVLPYWPRIYCKISLDHDRRVREATQQAFEGLITKVRKHLAPHLKTLMGFWLMAQCDPHSPAASAARAAFEAAFPPAKQAGAVAFCQDEILGTLQDHLLKETADTVSDPQTVPEEERKAKFFRILTCSLLALKKLLCLLPGSEVPSVEEKLKPLLSQSRFWKYGRHDAPQVRAAFFELVSALCRHSPRTARDQAARVCPAVLLGLDDGDPVVCPALWEAALYVLTAVEDCWSHVNARKGVFPKLWAVLREGGRGLATVVHPHLLPLVSKIPAAVTEPRLDFFQNFFTSAVQGLSSSGAVASPSERAAIFAAFMECCRFVMLQSLGADGEAPALRQMLIENQLVPLVGAGLRDPRWQDGPLFARAAAVLGSWEAAAESPGEDPEAAAALNQVLSGLWESLSRLCRDIVAQPEADAVALAGVSGLLRALRAPEPGVRRAGGVRFADGPAPEGDAPGPARPGPVSGRRAAPLEALVCRLAALSLALVNEHGSAPHLAFLSALLDSCPSDAVFRVLAGDGGEAGDPAVRFVERRLLPWLGTHRPEEMDVLVDILYGALRCCGGGAAARAGLLDRLAQAELPWEAVLLQVLRKACSGPAQLALVSAWLPGEVLGQRLVALADLLCDAGPGASAAPGDRAGPRWALLGLALCPPAGSDSWIGDAYVSRILDRLVATLAEAEAPGAGERLPSAVCDLASDFFRSAGGRPLAASAQELLLTVFRLCCRAPAAARLSDSLVCRLKRAWRSGLGSLALQLGSGRAAGTFLPASARWLKSRVRSSPLDVKSLQGLLSPAGEILEVLLEAGPAAASLLGLFLDELLPDPHQWATMRRALALQWWRRPLLEGRFCWDPEASAGAAGAADSPALPAHLCCAALAGALLLPALRRDAPLRDGVAQETVAELLYALQWCDELEAPPGELAEYGAMLQTVSISYEKLSHLADLSGLLPLLFARARADGALWALTVARLVRTRRTAPAEVNRLLVTPDGYGGDPAPDAPGSPAGGPLPPGAGRGRPEGLPRIATRLFPLTEGKLHTIQCLCPFLPKENQEELVVQCAARLLTCPETDICDVAGGLGYLAIVNSCLKTARVDEREREHGILKTILSWKNVDREIFLFSRSLKGCGSTLVRLNVEMIRFIALLPRDGTPPWTHGQWDFILCAMLSWLESTWESLASDSPPLVQLFACLSCDLASTLSAHFQSGAPDDGGLPDNLAGEWRDFFSEGIHRLLLPLLVELTEESAERPETPFRTALLESLGHALTFVSRAQLLEHRLPSRLLPGQRTNLPGPLQSLLNTLAPLLLRAPDRPVQVTAYHMLAKLMSELPQFDDEDLRSYGDEEEEPALSPPAALMSVLGTQEDVVDDILDCVPVGEAVTIQPRSPEFGHVLGYLLTWKLVLIFFKAASSQLRVLYSLHLRRTKSLQKLLYHLFRLMPACPVYPAAPGEPPAKEPKTFFTEELRLDVKGTAAPASLIPHLACRVYRVALEDLPAMVRLWWNGCDKRVFGLVDKFTSRHVSGALSAHEIASVQTSAQLFSGMTVKARSATREVVATYSVDDIFIELIIQLPPNYPLGSIAVESGKRVGVAVQQWRTWMLQLSTYLTHQNGSIMEGLALWKNNVDKRFEGVEDCMICFSVIHGFNYSLPKKACRTCKKKFHSACLYKWFTSSNKSTCPLCRETFF